MGCQFVHILVQFIVRAIFIQLLGIEYLGVNGLFSNILTMLALAELGVGNAIIFSMYKPLAKKDEKTIKALMNLYSKAYKLIALVIFILGIMVVPFLKYIIKEAPNVSENLTLLYLLFLLNSLTTYFFAYKRSLIIADQKEYIVTVWTQIFSIVANVIQIIFLYLTRNFIVYLGIQITFSLLTNLYLAHKANQLYPILKDKEKIQLGKEEKEGIMKNIKALILYKVGALLTIGLDNIIISSCMGIAWVGIYCNYTLIVDKLTAILSQIFTSMTASVGNLNTQEDMDKKEIIYKVMLYLAFWLFGVAGICIYILINPFIRLWIGETYLLDEVTVIVIALGFYFYGIHNPTMVYRNAMGLYVQGKLRPIIGAVVNGIVSILLVGPCGIMGVVLGTLMSRLLVLSWYEPLIIYKHGLKRSVKPYYMKYLYYALIFILSGMLTRLCVEPMSGTGIGSFILKGIISIIVPSGVFLIGTFKSIEFQYIWKLGERLIKKLIASLRGMRLNERSNKGVYRM